MKSVELLGKILYRVIEFIGVHIEGNENIARYLLSHKRGIVNNSARREIKKSENRGNIEHINHRSEYAEYEYFLLLCLIEMLILYLKFLRLSLFTVENLRYFHTRKILGEEGVYIGGRILYLTVSAS